MFREVLSKFRNRTFPWIFGLTAIAAGMLMGGRGLSPGTDGSGQTAARKPNGSPQLVSIQPLPTMDGEMCVWEPASASVSFAASFQEELRRDRAAQAAVEGDRAPVRVIRDTYPTYSAVTLDLANNELILQDENLFQILVYDRTANTPPTATMSEPKRVISGPATKVEFNCGLYVDPKTGDIYSVANDTIDTLTIFSRESRGNVAPTRELRTPHGTFGIAVDEGREEMYLTVQHSNSVVVYRKMAQGEEKPLRAIQGAATQLEDPHGIALDPKNGWIFVSNHGHARDFVGDGVTSWWRGGPAPAGSSEDAAPGTGRFDLPSITVYRMDASGNVRPLRTIEGPQTRLNWPSGMYYDPDHEELFVANDADDSVLVFRGTANGNAAPVRVIRGPKTGIKNPTGVFVDVEHQEVIVSNMGNHSATVFARDANGDVAPRRTVRAAPAGKQALAIGNPGAVGYDSKRAEILVPN
jgi:DNA-binding beta-propeller fold protein YncE